MVLSNKPFREPTRRTSRALRTVSLLLVLALLAVACGGGEQVATPDGNPGQLNDPSRSTGEIESVESDAVETAPTTSTTTTSTTTTTTIPETTTTTEPPPFATVQISTAGSDDNFGEPGAPVRSLQRALQRLEPGGTIEFEPGVYPNTTINGVVGLPGRPIRLVGGPGVQFLGDSFSEDAGILVQNSSNLEIIDMTVSGALWGIYVQNSNGITIRGNTVTDVGQEAIRIKDGSFNIVIDNNSISNTGRRTDTGTPNGEGIYIGTGTPGGVDLINNVIISNNTIDAVTDEAIDIKTPSTNISIVDNTITNVDTHTSGAIVIHLNNEASDDPNISLERNIVRGVTRSSEFRDGNCLVVQATVTVINNVFHDCQHRGVYLRGSSGVATLLHNTFIDSGGFGAIVDEGLGMEMVSENNLGVAGSGNQQASADDFTSLDSGNYRPSAEAATVFNTAAALGVTVDLFGATRSTTGEVTYGAVETG